MGNGCCKPCTQCCGKVQDWCRDSCGCCPCDCCKTAKIEVKAQETIERKVERKEIPFGYGLLHAGIRTADHVYTSPVLEVHTYRKSELQIAMNETVMSQRTALGGMQTERDTADRHIGPTRGSERQRIELDEDVVVIPVESILSIKYSSVVKRDQTKFRHVRLLPPQVVHRSCCERLGHWCQRTFCCCCCGNSEMKVHNAPEDIVTTISNQEAERKIQITIEYVHYNNIHTPSHIRALLTADQGAFYKDHLQQDTVQFYLLDNRDFEQDDFDLKRVQAATLCRLVTELKSMIGHYPDEGTLAKLIAKKHVLVIGEAPKENFERLVGPGTTNLSLEATVRPPVPRYKP